MTPSSGSPDSTLDECASEPLHLLGRTQRFGVLLAFDAARTIVAASGNCSAWCGQTPQALIGRPAETVLPRRSVDAAFAHARVAAATGRVQHLLGLAWRGRKHAVDVTVHASEGLVVVEAEPAGSEPPGAAVAVAASTRELADLRTVDALARSASIAVARITGFDRVMVYRFGADGTGTVIAEQLEPGQESYLGLRYPAGDIPPQAHRLYLRNPIRLIADTGDDGLPLATRASQPLDLSLSVLRSVSPVHLEYLRNMGTAASMSVSLIVDGRLWGLIACHHRRPLRPPLACRAMAESLGRLYSLALAGAERSPLEGDVAGLLLSADGVAALVDPDTPPAVHADACATVARRFGATGLACCIQGDTRTWGQVPAEAPLQRMVEALAARSVDAVAAIESLQTLAPGLAELAPGVAGVLAVPLAAHGRDWLLLLRDEVLQHVRWAGNPAKATTRRPDGRLSPRASFAAWQVSVRGHCEPWTVADVELARVLRVRLLELLSSRHEKRAIERAHRAAHHQALLVRELNHRVRNMLGVIKGLVQQTARNATSVADLTNRLHDRVHALSRAYTQIERANWQPTPLALLLCEETGAFSEPGQVTLSGPSVDLEPQAYISFALVVHELATNARKYGALSVPAGRVTVDWQLGDDGTLQIDWRESGGPRAAPPTRRGFGSRVIQESLEHHLGGETTMDFAPHGLHTRLRTQRGFVRATADGAAELVVRPAQEAPPSAAPLARPATALVLEDDLVIAILTEDMLRHLGCTQVRAAGTADDALELLQAHPVDIALIDVNLGDHTSERVAERLAALGVPTLVTTGFSDTDSVPAAMRGLPRLNKPFTQAELERAVDRCFAAARPPRDAPS